MLVLVRTGLQRSILSSPVSIPVSPYAVRGNCPSILSRNYDFTYSSSYIPWPRSWCSWLPGRPGPEWAPSSDHRIVRIAHRLESRLRDLGKQVIHHQVPKQWKYDSLMRITPANWVDVFVRLQYLVGQHVVQLVPSVQLDFMIRESILNNLPWNITS